MFGYNRNTCYIISNSNYIDTRNVKIDWLTDFDKIIKMSESVAKINIDTLKKFRGLNQSIFWSIVDKITWYDRDEQIMTKKDITKISLLEANMILSEMDSKYIPQLKSALYNTLLYTIDISDHNNALAHIIMKGKDFFDGIINNPEISLYLYDKYYPAYDWLSV